MSVTGVGSSYSYWYDSQSKKLSTKDGSKDAFVDYFNGELPEEKYGELNGYNAKMKNDIEAMIRLFSSRVSGANIFQSDDGLYDISAEILNGEEAKYSINGQHSFTGYAAIPYTKSQISQFIDYFQLQGIDGRIKEAGNTHVVPNSIYKEALERYEQWLYQPLTNRDLYMDDWERNYDQAN